MSSTGRCTVFKLVDHSRRFSWGFRWVFSRSHQAIALSHPTEMYHCLGPLLRLTTTSWGSSYLPYRNTTARALNAPRMIRLASRSAHPFFPHAARHGSWRSSSVNMSAYAAPYCHVTHLRSGGVGLLEQPALRIIRGAKPHPWNYMDIAFLAHSLKYGGTVLWLPLLDHRPEAGAGPIPMHLGLLWRLLRRRVCIAWIT